MRSCEAGVRNFGTPFDVFGDGMRCLVFLLCGHRADDSDDEEKSKKKLVMTRSPRVNTSHINTALMSNEHTWCSDHCETLVLSEQVLFTEVFFILV